MARARGAPEPVGPDTFDRLLAEFSTPSGGASDASTYDGPMSLPPDAHRPRQSVGVLQTTDAGASSPPTESCKPGSGSGTVPRITSTRHPRQFSAKQKPRAHVTRLLDRRARAMHARRTRQCPCRPGARSCPSPKASPGRDIPESDAYITPGAAVPLGPPRYSARPREPRKLGRPVTSAVVELVDDRGGRRPIEVRHGGRCTRARGRRIRPPCPRE